MHTERNNSLLLQIVNNNTWTKTDHVCHHNCIRHFLLLYTADQLGLVETHGLHPRLYADDTQILSFCRPGDNEQLQCPVSACRPTMSRVSMSFACQHVVLQCRVSACINNGGSWMRSNRLQLNTAKTEVLRFASVRRQCQIPDDLFGPLSTSPFSPWSW